MSYYKVMKSPPLCGEIPVQGSKNASLPIIAAALLNKGITVIKNYPRISDVTDMIVILENIGCKVKVSKGQMEIDASNISADNIPKEYVSKIRSSVIFMGALLGRCGEVKISSPGGCNIGERKIDIHLQIFTELGFEVKYFDDGEILAKGKINKDAVIHLKYASVGATENGILASVISKGKTIVLKNVAKEPEIVQLCQSINLMGGKFREQELILLLLQAYLSLGTLY